MTTEATTTTTKDAGDWLSEFRRAGLPCGPINTIPEVFDHPQAEARGLAVEAEHSTAGTVRFSGFPYTFSETPAEVRLPPPTLGQHTVEVLVDLLDYSAQDVAEFKEAGAI